MNTAKQKILENKQELMERKKIIKVINDWAGKNKKVFWKYEVSCFYKTYIIRVTNLPEPSEKDIMLSSNNRLLNDQQRKQLCDAITKVCAKAEVMNNSSIDVQIDYENGAVIAEIV